jgi:hypothetical protein
LVAVACGGRRRRDGMERGGAGGNGYCWGCLHTEWERGVGIMKRPDRREVSEAPCSAVMRLPCVFAIT